MRIDTIVLATATAVSLLVFTPNPTCAQPSPAKQEATRHYSDGVRFFNGAEYAEAAAAFDRSYALKSSWKILYNSGQSWAAAKRHGLALDAFERYLADGGDEVPAEREAYVLKEIDRLKNLVATVEIIGEDGDQVVIDSVMRGTLPEASHHKVRVGNATVQIFRGEEMVHEQQLRLISSSTVQVSVGAIDPREPPEDSTAESNSAEEEVALEIPDAPMKSEADTSLTHAETISDKKSPPTWAWIVAGAGVAVLGTGAFLGGMGYFDAEAIKEESCTEKSCGYDARPRLEKARNKAIAGDLLMGVGMATSVVGALGLFGVFDKNEEKDGPELVLNGNPLSGGGYVSLTGTF